MRRKLAFNSRGESADLEVEDPSHVMETTDGGVCKDVERRRRKVEREHGAGFAAIRNRHLHGFAAVCRKSFS